MESLPERTANGYARCVTVRVMPTPRVSAPRSSLRWSIVLALVASAAIVTALVPGRGAHAEDASDERAEQNERCALRLSIALQGQSPTPDLLASKSPQDAVDSMVTSPEFADRYARFVNALFNSAPSDANREPVYWLAKKVIEEDKPWSDLFVGAYAINPTDDGMSITDDPEGLGYFRSMRWMQRYAGNEPEGYMISAAFRVLTNTVGLTLTPSVGNPGDDRTEKGREKEGCRSCHFDAWYALDKFARVFPRRHGSNDDTYFTGPEDGPQQILGQSISDVRVLVTTLVDSDAFRFNQCRNVFKFLYGREENQCEAAVFDACVDALAQKKTLRSAVAAVAKDPSFCL